MLVFCVLLLRRRLRTYVRTMAQLLYVCKFEGLCRPLTCVPGRVRVVGGRACARARAVDNKFLHTVSVPQNVWVARGAVAPSVPVRT